MKAPDRTIAPPLATLPAVKIAPARELTLDGGARLTVVPGGDQPLARLVLMWEGGTFDMPSSAAMTVMADAMTEGTRSLTGEAIADAVDFEGARLNSRCAEHYAGLSLLSLSDRMTELLPLIKSIVCEPEFAPSSIDMIRRRCATAETVRRAKVSTRATRRAKQLMAGSGHAAARFDSSEDYMGVDSQSVKDAFCRTIGRGRRGLHAFLGGHFSAEVERNVINFIENLPDSGTEPSPVVIEPFIPEAPCRIDIPAEEAVQSAVSMAIPVIGREHPDYIPLRLTVAALGGYFGSRLMTAIREERGLTYGISAHLLGSPEGAAVQIDAQCSAASVEEVIEQTLAEVRGLWERRPDADELERLRLNAWSNLASQADSPLGTLDYYVTRLLVQTPRDYFARQMEAIASLNADMVADMARKYLSDGWSTVTCGPASL